MMWTELAIVALLVLISFVVAAVAAQVMNILEERGVRL